LGGSSYCNDEIDARDYEALRGWWQICLRIDTIVRLQTGWWQDENPTVSSDKRGDKRGRSAVGHENDGSETIYPAGTPMTGWLDGLRRMLDGAARSVDFFFRNDDVGWADERLPPLLDLFAARELPVDLSVIPAALGDETARRLSDRCAASAGRIRVHQHGWRHANHERAGRKCEFGLSRMATDQRRDLRSGHARLQAALGPWVDPVFTPPWNRCTQATVALLTAGSYRVLSRNAGAMRLDTAGLVELPVAVDWQKLEGAEAGGSALGAAITDAAAQDRPVGVMLHHAAMTEDGCRALAALLDLLARHERARCLTMMDCAALG
jgi:predicted deacetylase